MLADEIRKCLHKRRKMRAEMKYMDSECNKYAKNVNLNNTNVWTVYKNIVNTDFNSYWNCKLLKV